MTTETVSTIPGRNGIILRMGNWGYPFGNSPSPALGPDRLDRRVGAIDGRLPGLSV